MASSHGQKVTTDPETLNNPKNENPGMVAYDSLAGESVREGGSFAADSDYRGPMDQPARSLNANTTDTTNATKLDSAASAEARAAQDEWTEAQQLNAGSTLGASSGQSNGAAAPGYAAHPASSMGDNFQPKGQNLTEGGFDSSAPNASFTTNIGGKDDPGRAALEQIEASNASVAGGSDNRQQEITGQSQFADLGETNA